MPDRVLQLHSSALDEMVRQRHNLAHQLRIVAECMENGTILPYPFERSVILLRKANLYEQELAICVYVERWCAQAETEYDGWSAMHWRSPVLQRIIARRAKTEDLALRGG